LLFYANFLAFWRYISVNTLLTIALATMKNIDSNIRENGLNDLKLNILSQKYKQPLLSFFSNSTMQGKAQSLANRTLQFVINEIDKTTASINLDSLVFTTADMLINNNLSLNAEN